MDLIPYNSKLVPNARGIPNCGNSCYYNSLMQSLISCSSFYFELLKLKRNELYMPPYIKLLFDQYFEAVSNSNLLKPNDDYKFFEHAVSEKMIAHLKFAPNTQQDADHALKQIFAQLDILPNVSRLFMHRYRVESFCHQCEKIVKIDYQENSSIAVPWHFIFNKKNNSQTPIQNYLLQSQEVHEGWTCPVCSSKEQKKKTSYLVMLPEILVLVLDNYKSDEEKRDFDYTDELIFPLNKKQFLHYTLVARILHSGGVGGGHYTADALRRNGWYKFNDNTVTKLSELHSPITPSDAPSDAPYSIAPSPNKNVYMLFYHFKKINNDIP